MICMTSAAHCVRKEEEDKRAELSDDDGKGSAFHAPVEDELVPRR